MRGLIPQRHVSRINFALPILAALGLAGCQITDEQSNTSRSGSTPEAPIWFVPPGWERAPGNKPGRVATFTRGVQNEEIVVRQLKDNAEGEVAQVNLWRKRLGLPSLTDEEFARLAELKAEVRAFNNGTLAGHTVHFQGKKQHLIGAVIPDPAAGGTWVVESYTNPVAAGGLEINLFIFAGSFGTGKIPPEWDMGAQRPSTRRSRSPSPPKD